MRIAPSLSLVVPARNEAERLPPTIERLVRFCDDRGSTEIVLAVDVQSEDESVVIAEKLATDIPFLRLTEVTSKGKGHAVLAGLEAATGELALMVDCDLAVEPQEFPKLIELAETGAFAIASRSVPDARRIGEPLLRYSLGRIFNATVRAAILPRIRDTQCGFKAFRRDTGLELLREVRTRRWVFDVELIALALNKGVEVVEVPVTWYYRHGSTVQPLRHALGVGADLWAVWRHVGRVSSGR